MEFRLVYRGPLKTDRGPKDKHSIRMQIHPQLKELWTHEPLSGLRKYLQYPPATGEMSVIEEVESCRFAPVVTGKLHLVCDLDIIMLRPEKPGRVIMGGDVDNRLKTLFDALRCPKNPEEIPPEDAGGLPCPLHCSMQDDSLVSDLRVTCDRLLDPKDPEEVLLIVQVTTKVTSLTWKTIGL
jgi:hypothetical protein